MHTFVQRMDSEPSVLIRQCLMLGVSELIGGGDEGGVDLALAGQLDLDKILRERVECVEEAVSTRKIAKALLHRLQMSAPPVTQVSSDS